MTRRLLSALLIGSALLPGAALAGPFQAAEAQLRGAYAEYRIALFQSSAGNTEATATALQALDRDWAALSGQWTASPPSQYGDDPQLAETLAHIATAIGKARQEAGGGDLAGTHATLETIRDEIGDLHIRNGLIGFSDRMNAFHAEMEKVLDAAAEGGADLAGLRESAAVLAYLAADIAAHPAPEAADPAYAPLVDALLASVDALQSAARAEDADGAKTAIAGLKPAYAKLFVKFG